MAKTWFERLADGPIRTECLRIARKLVKDELRRQGIKVEFVEASMITKGATDLLICDVEHNALREAKANIKRRNKAKKDIKL